MASVTTTSKDNTMNDKRFQFGNLAKLVPLTIISAAVGVSLIIAVVNGLDYSALLEAGKVLVMGAGAAVIGSVTAAAGKSQTRIDLESSGVAGPVDYTSEAYAPVGGTDDSGYTPTHSA